MQKNINLILITCHDLGRHLNCYGASTVSTPNLDRLADEGMRCTNVFATAPQCSPSRASLTTGRYPHSTGVIGLTHGRFGWELNDDEIPLPKHLARYGYHTVLAGLQHEARNESRLMFKRRIAPVSGHSGQGDSDKQVAQKAGQFINSHTSTKEPFFLQVGLFQPHRRPETKNGFVEGASDLPACRDVSLPSYLRDTPEAREDMAWFELAVQQADEAVGILLDALLSSPNHQNTIVAFTSDHGIPFPRAKCTLFDAGLEIPLIIRGPGVPSGKSYNGLMSGIDVAPTLCDLLGVSPMHRAHGQSHLTAWEGLVNIDQQPIFAEMNYHDYYDPLRSIRNHQYKLIVSFEATRAWMDPTQRWFHRTEVHPDLETAGERHPVIRLYDLVHDPGETNNLVSDTQFRSVRKALALELLEWMEQTSDPLLNFMAASPAYHEGMDALYHAAQKRSGTTNNDSYCITTNEAALSRTKLN